MSNYQTSLAADEVMALRFISAGRRVVQHDLSPVEIVALLGLRPEEVKVYLSNLRWAVEAAKRHASL